MILYVNEINIVFSIATKNFHEIMILGSFRLMTDVTGFSDVA